MLTIEIWKGRNKERKDELHRRILVTILITKVQFVDRFHATKPYVTRYAIYSEWLLYEIYSTYLLKNRRKYSHKFANSTFFQAKEK